MSMNPKRFYSENNIPMVEGHFYNWEEKYEYPGKQGRLFYVINVGTVYNMRSCTYVPAESKLTIRSMINEEFYVPLLCKAPTDLIALQRAEVIVMALHEGMGVEPLKIYQKQN